MDTSETYIKMCEKAEEIQEWGKDYDKWTGEWKFRGKVWLPRQDQLQEMIEAVDTSPYKLHLALTRWLESEVGLPPPFDSMEQLWLAFVMKEEYNKVWDGEDWIIV